MNIRRGNRGFTLVELMIVIAILGILVLVGFPVFSEGQVGARRNSCLDRQKLIFEAALLYSAHNIVPDGTLSVAVLAPDYIQAPAADCPMELDGDGDDYDIIFQNGEPIDVICNVAGDNHPWEP